MTALRPGAIVWRIGPRSNAPLRAIVVRLAPGAYVDVRASTFSRNELRVPAEDVFADREACRTEINRRADHGREQ